jgi:lipid-A-disaccharide synthase-like uncharacterized protein
LTLQALDVDVLMNTVLGYVFGLAITPWKLVGYTGVGLFAGRWLVQLMATQREGRPVMPMAFWAMSVSGSALLLVYFIWGRNDSVGVLSNLFPMAVALYNWALESRARRGSCDAGAPMEPAKGDE